MLHVSERFLHQMLHTSSSFKKFLTAVHGTLNARVQRIFTENFTYIPVKTTAPMLLVHLTVNLQVQGLNLAQDNLFCD